MNPNDIEISHVKINNKIVEYDEEPLQIKTDWISAYFNKDYKIINCAISKGTPLYNLFKTVDEMVLKMLPEKYKQVKILRSYVKDGETKYSIKPVILYSKIFNDKKEPLNINDLMEMMPFECRFIFTFRKVYNHNTYYGTNIIAKQLQVRHKQPAITSCMFD